MIDCPQELVGDWHTAILSLLVKRIEQVSVMIVIAATCNRCCYNIVSTRA